MDKNVNQLPEKEEVLMNENQILNGLLEAANFKDDKKLQRVVQIKRENKVLFEFRIKPLNEEEVAACRKNSTLYTQDPRGKSYPKIEKEFDFSKYRSWKIYFATVDEDKERFWDNKAVQNRLNVLQNINVIDSVLMYGEKLSVANIVDEISACGENIEEYIKN